MTNPLSVDVDFMEHLPAKTMLELAAKIRDSKRWTESFALTVNQCAPMFVELEALDIEVRFSLLDGDINLNFTGDGERLRKVWTVLRRAGYRPVSHPEKGKNEFYTHWYLAGMNRLWMHFTSNVCRRVQVGTETKEVPVYEVQCGELPVLEDAPEQAQIAAPVAALTGTTDIPF